MFRIRKVVGELEVTLIQSTKLKGALQAEDQVTWPVHCKKSASYISGVNSICHYLHPPFKGRHLKEGQVGPANMVKLHLRVHPHGVVLLQAGRHVRDYLGVDGQPGRDVKALEERIAVSRLVVSGDSRNSRVSPFSIAVIITDLIG